MKKALALMLCLLFLLSGCATPPNEPASTTYNAGKPEGKLSVYYVNAGNYAGMTYASAIEQLRGIYVDLELEMTVFETTAEMDQRLTTELPAGKGPDLILFSSTDLDIYRMMQNGAFADLAPIIDANGLRLSYTKAALDAGAIDGRQYLFPLTLDVLTLNTSVERLEALGQTASPAISTEDLLGLMDASMAIEDAATSPFMLNMGLEPASALPTFVQLYAGNWLDTKTGLTLDADTLQSLVDRLKLCLPIAEESKNASLALASSDLAFMDANRLYVQLISFGNLPYHQTLYSMLDETAVLRPILTAKGESSALLGLYGAVPVSSQNPEAATLFLHAFGQVPASRGLSGEPLLGAYLPAHKGAGVMQLNRARHYASYHRLEYAPGRSVNLELLKPETYDLFADWYINLEVCTLDNGKANAILTEALLPYMNDEKDFESCYADLTRRLTLYLNE